MNNMNNRNNNTGNININRNRERRLALKRLGMKRRRMVKLGVIALMIIFFVTVITILIVKNAYLFKKSDISVADPVYKSDKLFYNSLTRKSQLLYEQITDSAFAFEDATPDMPYSYTSDEFNLVVKSIMCDNPTLFYLDYNKLVLYSNESASKTELSYLVSKEEAKNMLAQVNEAVDTIVGQCKNEDDYITEINVHDYLVRNCSYLKDNTEVSAINNSIYGALIGKNSLCDGYALAFKEILNRCGIYCTTVYGTVGELNHIWNIVNVNEQFYQIDVTWDDADDYYGKEMMFHGYFNITDEEMSRSHTATDPSIYPKCTDTDNYYVHMGICSKDRESEKQIVKAGMLSSAEKNQNYFEMAFGYGNAYSDLRQIYTECVQEINAEGVYNFTDALRQHYCSDDNNKLNIEIYYGKK